MVPPSRLYLIPGLGGTELWDTLTPSLRVWVSRARLVFGGLRLLWLDGTGYAPLPDVGIRCVPTIVLESLYDAPWTALATDARLAEWDTVRWGYDWRLPLESQGARLGLDILTHVATDAPCTLVGHSNGGAVARYAWSWLRGQGREGLVRRIITLGTPHQGSYATVTAMLSTYSALWQISALQAGLVLGVGGGLGPAKVPLYTPRELARLTQSWPSFYDLFPNPFGYAFSGDRNLSSIFEARYWPAWGAIQQPDLTDSYDVLLPAAVDPANIPPPWVLTTAGGTGYETPCQIQRLPLLGISADVGTSAAGDGSVMLASALIAGAKQSTWQTAHNDLVAATVADGWLATEILDERSAPHPAPPPTRMTGVTPPTLGAPPLVPYLLRGGQTGRPIVSCGPDP